MNKIENTVWAMAEPIAEQNGLELIEVEFVKEGADWYLRLYLDKEDGTVELDDCEKVSRLVSDQLDINDPIEQAYRLEVSSPGIERPLKRDKDFLRFKGEKVRAKVFVPINGQKEFVGELGEVDAQTIHILCDGESISLPRDKVSKVNLEWEF